MCKTFASMVSGSVALLCLCVLSPEEPGSWHGAVERRSLPSGSISTASGSGLCAARRSDRSAGNDDKVTSRLKCVNETKRQNSNLQQG